jgi:hypothetical protein
MFVSVYDDVTEMVITEIVGLQIVICSFIIQQEMLLTPVKYIPSSYVC